MNSKILDCKECMYEENCPVYWHEHNAACLTLQKEKTEYDSPCCNNCLFYDNGKCTLYNCEMKNYSICFSWRRNIINYEDEYEK